MGHGRHEPPQQGSVGQHVDGDRGEPLFRLARSERFRPTRQSGRRQKEMDQHQGLVRQGRQGQQTEKVPGSAGAQEEILSVRSPAVLDTVHPGHQRDGGRQRADGRGRDRGAEEEEDAKDDRLVADARRDDRRRAGTDRGKTGDAGGRAAARGRVERRGGQVGGGRDVPAGRRPVVHGVAAAHGQVAEREAKDQLQNRRAATVGPYQVQRGGDAAAAAAVPRIGRRRCRGRGRSSRVPAVRRARPQVFPGAVPAEHTVPVHQPPPGGRVVHAAAARRPSNGGRELFVHRGGRAVHEARVQPANVFVLRHGRRRTRIRFRRQLTAGATVCGVCSLKLTAPRTRFVNYDCNFFFSLPHPHLFVL